MRHRRPAGAALRHAVAGPAITLCALVLVACGGGGSPDQPSFGVGDIQLTPGPSARATPTALVYTGRRISLTNTDNGTQIAADLGSDLLVNVTVPLADDCQASHPCAEWHVDDAAGVLTRAQELTTCDKDACTAQREHFLGRTGAATLALIAVQQCSPYAGSHCEAQPLSTLWSAHVTVGKSV